MMESTRTIEVGVSDLADLVAAGGLELRPDGTQATALALVDLSHPLDDDAVEAACQAAERAQIVLVGLAPGGLTGSSSKVAEALTCTLTDTPTSARAEVFVVDLRDSVERIERSVDENPRAATTLCTLLRATCSLPVEDALAVESFAYSMLLAGDEFAHWRALHPRTADRPSQAAAVLMRRDGGLFDVTLNRPEKHNAYDRLVRDGLVEAFDLAALDPLVTRVRLSGNGRSFCSGGDLNEFGTSEDVTTAHLIRLDRSVGARIHRCTAEVDALLHGACIGAGIEIAAFAQRVYASPDAFFLLPELAMGLLPGAGGTVSIPRRIGRWRTAYLALSAERIGVDRALDWGLVDGVINT